MKFIENATDILRTTEQAVASLARQAVEQRDYAMASTLTSLAGELRDLAERIQLTKTFSPIKSGIDFGAVHIGGETNEALLRSARRRPKKGEFPKFLRNDGTLFKLGWSKAERSIYEHKAPKSAMASLVKKLRAVGANRRRFTVVEIIPLQDLIEESEVPSYQVYLCLAWLRTTGLLVQHGRQGYSITHPSRLETEFESHWKRLPLKQDT